MISLFDLLNNKLSDKKLSDNNLASEQVKNRSFFNLSKIEEIVIFMTSIDNMSDKGSLDITLMNGDECFCIPWKGIFVHCFSKKGLRAISSLLHSCF